MGHGQLVAGRYELGELLGRGGMAEVRAGRDRRLQRPVAVKTLRPEMAVRDDIRVRFEAEARAAARLSHPNAVSVYDVGEDKGVPFIVMERLPGETLADRIAAGLLDPEWVRLVGEDVLAALAAAHAAGIVHRDVKPGNILLAADERVKVADFGIAKSATDASGGGGGDAIDITLTGQLLGTPAYLAPERLRGGEATPQSDLFALGVVLYEALAGEKPYRGANALAVAHAVQGGEHRPLVEARAGVDPALAAVVEQAMDPDPARRFASAEAMARALATSASPAVTTGAPTVAMTRVPEATQVLPVAPSTLAAPTVEQGRTRRRGAGAWAWLAAAAVAALLLVGAVVALAGNGGGGTTGSDTPANATPKVATTSAPTSTTAAPTTTTQAPLVSVQVPQVGGHGKHKPHH